MRFGKQAVAAALAAAQKSVNHVKAARQPSRDAYKKEVDARAAELAKMPEARNFTLGQIRDSARSKVSHAHTVKLREATKPADAAVLGARQLFLEQRALAQRPRTIDLTEPTLDHAEQLGLLHTDKVMWLQIRKNDNEMQRVRIETERMRIAFETSTMSARDLFEDFAAAEAAGDIVRAEYLDARIDRAIERMPAPQGKGVEAVNAYLREKAAMAERVAQIRNGRLGDDDRQAIAETETALLALSKEWSAERSIVEIIERRRYVNLVDESDAPDADAVIQPLGVVAGV